MRFASYTKETCNTYMYKDVFAQLHTTHSTGATVKHLLLQVLSADFTEANLDAAVSSVRVVQAAGAGDLYHLANRLAPVPVFVPEDAEPATSGVIVRTSPTNAANAA